MNLDNTLWMGGIQPGMTESHILSFFAYFNIFPTHVKFIRDKLRNKNKSYCFISFKSTEEAKYVLNYLNGQKIPNTDFIFKLNLADYKGESKTVYVGGLNPNVKKEDLLAFFKQNYNSVHNARIICDENEMSKGYGFVNFKTEEDYFRCLKEMDGILFFGNNIKVREQTKKDEDNNYILNKKRKGNIQNNIYIKNNLININNIANNNDIMIQNNIINNTNNINNSFLNYNHNNIININNSMFRNINNNKGTEYNNINNVQNIYENNNMAKFPNNINNLIGINNINNYLKEEEKLINNFNSNQPKDNFINKTNLSSFFLNDKKTLQNSKMSNKENVNILFLNEQRPNANINMKQNASYDVKTLKKDENIEKQNIIKIKNKNTERKKFKLEILEKIDEITLYKKIHESILRTFSNQQILFSKTGVKFKSKFFLFLFLYSVRYVCLLLS